MNPIISHPNASRGTLGTLIGAAIVWGLNKYAHTHLNDIDAIAIAGGIGNGWVFIGRDGIKGAFQKLWNGESSNPNNLKER